MQTEHLSPEAAQIILNTLPERIQLGLRAYAAQIDYPIELVIEMMIAGFLDEDAMTFEGCKPLRGMDFVKVAS
ncbi:hypothetical protein H6F89_31105 [Cyanobacteria bacterium FACHB-63]|nr:hypothetical protein [Cyanobacteria bacterium FACHB-63]